MNLNLQVLILYLHLSGRNRIVAAWIERIAPENAIGTHEATFEKAVDGDGLLGVFGATGSKPAASVGKSAQALLVHYYEGDAYFLQRREITVHSFSVS